MNSSSFGAEIATSGGISDVKVGKISQVIQSKAVQSEVIQTQVIQTTQIVKVSGT